jgi:hypothetical protein
VSASRSTRPDLQLVRHARSGSTPIPSWATTRPDEYGRVDGPYARLEGGRVGAHLGWEPEEGPFAWLDALLSSGCDLTVGELRRLARWADFAADVLEGRPDEYLALREAA